MCWLFAYAEEWLDKVAMVNFQIFNATVCTTNKYNTHITKHVKK